MKWTGLNELRESFLSFFESKGHLRLKSFSLIPAGDKSLLLINSGMAPMKPYFLGTETPPCKRVVTCQKCIRTPDLDHVGKTARHGTFFEMLGNFSFGDYFKKDAIAWSWEYLTEVLGIPQEKLWPSVYVDDDEAYGIWTGLIGIPPERVVKLGKADNFWEHGSGPCGPCSEIYYDRGPKYGCGDPDCKPGCECDRYMEIWNNVFSQFNNDGKGNYTELQQKNIDTGMGLERLACVMQGVDNLFEVDTIRKILDTVCDYAHKPYGVNERDDVSIRIVTDHIRSASFMICDGVMPSNEGRGYVLRRLIRRAARHARLLGITGAFLHKLCEVVIEASGKAYPELEQKREMIGKVLLMEEERFDATIDMGLTRLNALTEALAAKGENILAGNDAFVLYDTYGFPLDLTKEILSEQGMSVDEDAFSALMQEQRVRARDSRKSESGWQSGGSGLFAAFSKTEFVGYHAEEVRAEVLAIEVDGELRDSVDKGSCTVVLDRTPFYAESGGQVGDTGVLTGVNARLTVVDTHKADGIVLHLCEVQSGTLTVGEAVAANIDSDRRNAIRRNHSAAHLLQAALKQVLGDHIAQAGSYVDEHRVRFDFTHFKAVEPAELAQVERMVNQEILAGHAVQTVETGIEEAKKMGATALFGEKYGKTVRVVRMGDFSIEFCGGTHIDNTAKVGLFKILSESSVAAGVRRIEGTTGMNVIDLVSERDELLSRIGRAFKTGNPLELAEKAEQNAAELKGLKAELAAQGSVIAELKSAGLLGKAVQQGPFRVVSEWMDGFAQEELRAACDKLKERDENLVVLLASGQQDQLYFCAACGKQAVANGAHAGKIVQMAAQATGGRGGGRPDSASAGGKEIAMIPQALNSVSGYLQQV